MGEGFATAAVILATALSLFLLWGGLKDCIHAWQNGKLKVEQEKTKQEELKLERAKLENNKQQLS